MNWKTTTIGFLTIIVAVGSAALGFLKSGAIPDIGALGAAVMAGVGLIHAADSKPQQ